MILFHQVSKRYQNGFLALNDVSFQMESGDFAFITGHSGAGKSTMLKLIAAMEPANQGQIIVARKNINRLANRHIPFLRRQMGIILQTPHLLPTRTVFENVALPLTLMGYTHKEIQNRVRAVLAKVSLHNKELRFPQELSSGEQQRVAIARAVVHKPQILLADEPTGNLDPKLAAEIMQLFEQFNELGTTVLIASHDLALINQMQRRTLTLANGKLIDA